MKPIKIFTDSTCDLNKENLAALGIEVLPLHVVFKNDTYEDGVNITTAKLYELIEQFDELPKTAATSPKEFSRAFKPWLEKGYDIIYTGISSLLSGTFQNAEIARQELDANSIFLVDSLNLSSAIGLQLLKAAKLRDAGHSAQEIVKAMEVTSHKVKCSFAIDTMTYLYKGGRCSGMTYFFGKMFHIHPIISVVNGGMIVHKTPRGKMVKAIDLMIKEFKDDLVAGLVDVDTIMVTHSESQEYAEYISKALEVFVEKKHLMVTNAGCVISSHCGPKTAGILYITK